MQCTFGDESGDVDGNIVERIWDFGDGQQSALENPDHVFSDVGSYPVTLTVMDDQGEVSSSTQLAFVTNVLHVSNIIVSDLSIGNGLRLGQAQVSVVDSTGLPVEGAEVRVTFTGGLNKTVVTNTDNSGGALIESSSQKGRLRFTVCVESIDRSGYEYDQSLSEHTCSTF